MPLLCDPLPVPARVDTAQLRALIKAHAEASAAFHTLVEAQGEHMTVDEADAIRRAHDDRRHSASALEQALQPDLPALLDEVDTARALIRDVLEHGLSSVEPLKARALYARLEQASKES